MNGVNSVVRESDLLDRTLMLNLKRIKSTENKTELQIWKEFDKDIPKILGCCFQCLATALNNTEAIEITERIRLADFHEACIRAGRVLEYTEDEVTELLLKNQNVVNNEVDEMSGKYGRPDFSIPCNLGKETMLSRMFQVMRDNTRNESRVSEGNVEYAVNTHRLKVYANSPHHGQDVAQIILQGKWVEKWGFTIGSNVRVDCYQNKLVIVKEDR